MKQRKLIFNFFVNRNWKKLTDSRKRAKILADNRKSHHPIETLVWRWASKIPRLTGLICGLSLLLVLSFAPRSFSSGPSVFSLFNNQRFQIPIRNETHGHVSKSSQELLSSSARGQTNYKKNVQLSRFVNRL